MKGPRTATRVIIGLLLLCSAGAGLRAGERWNPAADPAAMVTSGEARFTVLTSCLVRMEWSPAQEFEDRASLVFVNRRLPVPRFTVVRKDGWLSIRTDSITVAYEEGSGRFTANSLRVTFTVAGGSRTWVPGMKDTANLGGTTRTLDGVQGSTPLEPGLLSRDGWVLVDDTDRPLFDGSDWPWVTARKPGDRQDYYLFAHGRNYRRALGDFVNVAGRIPMPPRFAFGFWWSRYWAYSDSEFRELVDEFSLFDVPLDVLVVDMDWHETFELRWDTDKRDQAGQRLGWTGYTWNRAYFPDPPAFLSWCASRGLKTTLNLHPASGIQPHEEAYPAMARAMGVVPEIRRYIPFDITDKKFAQNYLDIVLRPLERQGVDFWWLDWQQWGTTKIPGVTPTWWLNYVHFTDMQRQEKARPLIFHRWGGLGNHRYQIGFSGDAISVWESLRFQPSFTATAANVGFGYWSHDIGGHMPGPVSPELYTRWIQFGAFSPILRTHTTKNPLAERRIWAYPPEYFRIMRDAVRLRYSLIPYTYTAARTAYESGVSLCAPMYIHWPELTEAYKAPGQYMFGDRMLVAPVTDSITDVSRLARKRVWIPPGEWFEWCTGSTVKGPAVVEREFAIDEVPVYLKAGSIVPMQAAGRTAGAGLGNRLVLTVFPGDSGSTRVYDDAGNTDGYTTGECAWSPVRFRRASSGSLTVDILPVEGSYPGMPGARAEEMCLVGCWPPAGVTVNGRELVFSASGNDSTWCYDGDKATVSVFVPPHATTQGTSITLTFPRESLQRNALLDGVPGTLSRLRRVIPWLNNTWPREWSPDDLVEAAQTGDRISLHPAAAVQELEDLERSIPTLAREIDSLKLDEGVRRQVLGHLRAILENHR
jgi:alpha-glucosidase (family GH31 glycosyl hydrolase)